MGHHFEGYPSHPSHPSTFPVSALVAVIRHKVQRAAHEVPTKLVDLCAVVDGIVEVCRPLGATRDDSEALMKRRRLLRWQSQRPTHGPRKSGDEHAVVRRDHVRWLVGVCDPDVSGTHQRFDGR